jgi:CheY-like chemotaxis protein
MAISELIYEPEAPEVTDVAPLRVLVVDDSHRVGELIKDVLLRVEHAVDVVGSSREALAALEHATYDVVISEQYLGGREPSGTDLARLVHRKQPATGFIVATESLASVTDLTNVDAVLLKPFCVIALREMVNRAGARGSGYSMV